MPHFAERLVKVIQDKGNAVCVGFDPRWEALPQEIRQRHARGTLAAMARAFEEFGARLIDCVAPLVPILKPQSAFFEACGPEGMVALQRLLRRARDRGLLTILDAKRNDIASTAAAYADAAFAGIGLEGQTHPVWDADALTVNPYLGRDAIEPFLVSARQSGRGLFILVRTSNPGAGQFQDLNCDGRPLYRHVAEAVRSWTRENLHTSGFGDVGAVVGATYPAEMAALRQALPEVPFLVPGFGAQGGNVSDTAAAFRMDGLGAIINSSRGIICSFAPTDSQWETAIESATRATIQALREATPMGRLELKPRMDYPTR